MDELDRKIVERLMREGRATWATLAETVGLSAPSVAERVKRLEERGIIRGYGATIDPAAVGLDVLAFVSVAVDDRAASEELVEWADSSASVQECHVVAGDHDFLLKVRCRDPEDLERFLREELRALRGVSRTRTTMVLGSRKETNDVPLPG